MYNFERSDPKKRNKAMNKKAYIKPEQRIIVLQHQSHLLQASGEVLFLGSGGPFYYGGSDENYTDGAR